MDRRSFLAATLALPVAAPTLAQGTGEPLVFAFQPQKDPAGIKAAADKVSAYLTRALNRPVRTMVPGAYAATVQALVSRRADIAYLSSLPFLLARRDGDATLLLAEARADGSGKVRTDYDSVFVVPASSPMRSFDDLRRQAKRLRMIFTSTTSTSGFVFPYARLVRDGVLRRGQPPEAGFAQVLYGGGYTQALEQLLAGRGDVAAVSDYTVEGPRADTYLPADKRRQLRVLARTPGVPTHLIAARGGLDRRTRDAVAAALLALAKDEPRLLSDVYGAAGLVRVDERAHVAATVDAIARTGLPIAGLVK